MRYSIGVPVMVFVDINSDNEQYAKGDATELVSNVMNNSVGKGNWDWIDVDYDVEIKDSTEPYDWLGEQQAWEQHLKEREVS